MLFFISASFSAHASFIQSVSGADLAGIEVTVLYTDGTTETDIWEATSTTAGGAFSNTGTGWSLTLDGDSFGSNSPEGLVGGFYFYTGNYALSALYVEMIGTPFVFDIFEGDNGDGTGAGRPFVLDVDFFVGAIHGYPYLDSELFQYLELYTFNGGFTAQTEFVFVTDIDAIAEDVPAPNGLLMLALALAGVRLTRRNH